MIVSYCFIPLKKATTTNKEEGVNKSVVVATTEKRNKNKYIKLLLDAVMIYDLSGRNF
jgi:hypothetical protein